MTDITAELDKTADLLREHGLDRHAAICDRARLRIACDAAELGVYRSPTRQQTTSLTTIKRAVTAQFGVEVADIMAPTKRADILLPRQVVMYLAREKGFSWNSISKALDRDRTACRGGAQKIIERMHRDPEFNGIMQELRNGL